MPLEGTNNETVVLTGLSNQQFLEQYAEASTAFHHAIELAPPNAENVAKFRTYLKAAEEMMARR